MRFGKFSAYLYNKKITKYVLKRTLSVAVQAFDCRIINGTYKFNQAKPSPALAGRSFSTEPLREPETQRIVVETVGSFYHGSQLFQNIGRLLE